MTLNQRSLHTLEFYKIAEKLAGFAVSEKAKEAAVNLSPVYTREEAESLLSLTADADFLLNKKGGPPLYMITDITGSVQRADKGASLSLKELLDIARVLTAARQLCEYVDRNMEALGIKGLFDAVSPNKYLEEKLTSSIISSEEVADSASAELAAIRRAAARATAKARDILAGIIKNPSYQKILQESIVTMRGERYVVPVRAEFKNEIKGLVHDVSGTGSTLFIEPMGVVEANNELRVLKVKEQKEIERIIAELSALVADDKDRLIGDFEAITEIDLIFAKAKLAQRQKAVRPKLNDKGILKLINARHPLILPAEVVPINLTLGEDYDLLVITGPNTGGKTVALKTAGLLTLMAQAGLFIPCNEGSEAAVFENIFSDIGDEQSIEQSLSTFSSHMTNIVKIMEKAGKGTLALFDELGAGTDPVEGAALAIAILEQVKALGVKAMATTHYAELKTYALKTERVENASCEFNVETLRPTYRLLTGIPGKSNAFAISARLGLDPGIIERASGLIDEESAEFDRVLGDLEQKRVKMEAESERAKALNKELSALKQELSDQKEKLAAKIDKETQKARQEAKRVLSASKRMYEELMSELEELKKQKDKEDFSKRVALARKDAKEKFATLEDAVSRDNETGDDEGAYTLPRPLAAGDTVIIAGIDTSGEVIAPEDAKGMVLVRTGSVRSKISAGALRLVEESSKQQPRAISRVVRSQPARPALELDLRGQTVDEAVLNIDKFLDDAVMSGMQRVSIIHGKGTGALRAGVTEYLRGHPHVESYRLGKYGEGETGVTIIELKQSK